MQGLPNPTSKQKIYDLLDDLPPQYLEAVQQFAAFLREQAKRAQETAPDVKGDATSFRYPTVSLSLNNLSGLVGLAPPVGGDALAETEALTSDIQPVG